MVSKANSFHLPSAAFAAFVVGVVVIAVVVFQPALNGPFVFDDYRLPFTDPAAGGMPPGFWIGGVRPLLMASYWANFAAAGVDPWSYHATSLALHCIAAMLVFLVLRRILAISGYPDPRFRAAVFGAALFLLHPLQTESVDYVAGRSEVLCGIFVLAGWLIFLRRMDRPPGVIAVAGILLCALAAVLSKESGACLAPLLVASDYYWGRGSFRARLRMKKLLYLPLLAGFVAAVVIIIRALNRSVTAGFSASVRPWPYALTECRAILTYLWMFIVPAGQNVDWQMPIYRSLREAWPWIVLMAAFLTLIWWLRRKAPLASFGLLVFLLALSPTSSFIPVNDAMAERRMYLPIVGLVVFLIAIAGAIRLPAGVKAVAAATVLMVCAVLSNDRSKVWSSDLLLWQDSIRHAPGNARAYAGLGGAFILRSDCASAAQQYRKVVELEGMNADDGRNLANAYECSSQNDLALATYKEMVAVHPDAAAWARIGYLEALKNHVDVSLAAFENALRLDPDNAIAFAYRGTGRLALGDRAGADSDFRKALSLDPANKVAAMGLAKMQAVK